MLTPTGFSSGCARGGVCAALAASASRNMANYRESGCIICTSKAENWRAIYANDHPTYMSLRARQHNQISICPLKHAHSRIPGARCGSNVPDDLRARFRLKLLPPAPRLARRSDICTASMACFSALLFRRSYSVISACGSRAVADYTLARQVAPRTARRRRQWRSHAVLGAAPRQRVTKRASAGPGLQGRV